MPPGVSGNGLSEGYGENPYHSRVQLMNVAKEGNITYRKLSEVGNMNLCRPTSVLLGVILTDDRGFLKSASANDNNRNIVLGTICVDDVNLKLEELRKMMCDEIPCLPGSFTFLTKEGWPILKKQEISLKTSHLINEKNIISIKKQFEKQKVGIVVSGGDPIGFVFVDICSDVRQLRDCIEQQLKMSQHLKMEYRFIEKNGWPVMQSQETLLSITDLMLGQIVCIQTVEKSSESSSTPSHPARPTSVAFTTATTTVLPENRLPASQDVVDHELVNRKKSFKFLRPDNQISMKGRKHSQKRIKYGKDDVNLAKPILISYVRAEAAQYALDLKNDLVNRGFSVYLDVHEIKTGSDWQDSLNSAVTHCFLFVPLITPMYGKTQWTNREVKLADLIGKLIVPVNFLDYWPPGCLAIQFASTQYIPWKAQETDHVKGEPEKVCDSRVWPHMQLQRVASQIAECYKENCERWLKPQLSSGRDPLKLRLACPIPDEMTPRSPHYDEICEEKKHNIVISVHPKQKHVAQDLKALLESEGHEVWCSIYWQESQDNLSSPSSPHDLPTISEGEVFFSQQESELMNSVIESKKCFALYKEPETYGRRPLSRLMSQFSDISQPCTLSQEKLDRLRIFQQKVDLAGVVIVLVSEDYTKSTFSHQQVFYCEHRKRVVMVKCDNAQIPKWFRLLMGNDMILRGNNPQFECVLKARVKRALNPASETLKDATFEAKINYLVKCLKRNIPLRDLRVYVTGSTKLQTRRAEDICCAIGKELAKVFNVSLITNGFFGVPDITAKAFYECCESSYQSSVDSPPVMHVLPIHETEDLKSKASQNPDGSFEPMPYGKTFFIGDTLKERETAVARLADMCIVIEGGPGVVHEIEEFIWNDHFVIPIRSTNGAAGGKYGIPMKIFELPPGVDSSDWAVLSELEASPEDVAKAVVNIIFSLKKAVSSPTSTLKSPNFFGRKSRKKNKKPKRQQNVLEEEDFFNDGVIVEKFMIEEGSSQRNKYAEHGQHAQANQETNLTFKKRKWWRRLFKIFKRS